MGSRTGASAARPALHYQIHSVLSTKVFSQQICWVIAPPPYFSDLEVPGVRSLLHPKVVYIYMSRFTDTPPGCYTFRCDASVTTYGGMSSPRS